jgi:phosphate uptake regulator
MDIRNVQKTGDMFYVYLPTSWCREHKIGNKSKVSLTQSIDGSLIVSPELTEKKPKDLDINISEDNQEIIHKLVVACYINPFKSFRINLGKELDFTELLNRKRLISLESVELDKKMITSESTITVTDPDSLLKTMVRKIKNMITVLLKNYNKELIDRYEDEIDRSKILIDKSIITSLTFQKQSKLKTIDLYYITLISKDLERMVDHIINLPKSELPFFKSLFDVIDYLLNIVENTQHLDYKKSIEFLKKLDKIKKPEIKDIKAYDKYRIILSLDTIGDVIMDWAITKEVEKN